MSPATLLLVSSELCVDLLDTAPLPPDLDAGVPDTALLLLTGDSSLDPYLGRSTGTKARKKTTIAGLGMVEQEARGLAGTGSRHGQSATSMESAASMETMDMEDRAVCMVVQAPPQGGPSSRSIQMVSTQGLEKQESKEPSPVKGKEQCIGNRQDFFRKWGFRGSFLQVDGDKLVVATPRPELPPT
ncbi:uncharacterized protein UHOD_11698 [Ustilago sp. UG-2017b]|nr:uncharacterized protein UHOD_11698 [Ustilago sp. UG-2017b]